MSKLRHIPYAVLAVGLLFAGGASAQTWYDSREANQRERIQEGRRDGSITGREYDRLMQDQHRIERYERYAERDGHVNGRERANLDRMLDREGRDIYRQSHDGQTRGHNGWGHDGRDGRDDRGNGRDGWNRSSWGQNNGGRDRDGRDGWNHNGGNHNGSNQGGNWNHNGGNHNGGNHNGWNQSGNGNQNGGNAPGNWNRGPRANPAPTQAGAPGGTTQPRWGGNHGGTRTPPVVTPTTGRPTQAFAPRTASAGGGSRGFGGGNR